MHRRHAGGAIDAGGTTGEQCLTRSLLDSGGSAVAVATDEKATDDKLLIGR